MLDAYHNGHAKTGKRKSSDRRHFEHRPVERRPLDQKLGVAVLACLLPVILGSCGNTRSVASDATQIAGFRAGVVADEPRAALIGRTVIANGGNAADGAVAAYFAMSVTLPSAAGLGGGGICIAHDAEEQKTEVIDFLPRAAAGGQVAIPGNVRGMAALNARYGKMQFGGLVGQAEGLAQTGAPVSKALARELQQYGDALRADPALANIFLRADGSLVADGDNIRQTDLSASLGQVRAQGVNGFYGGLLGQALVEGAQAIGAPLTIEDLRNYKVQISPPVETQFTDLSLYVPGPPVTGGQLLSQAVALLNGGDNSPAAQMNISRQLMASQGGVTQNPSAASVVAVDSDGVAVACAFTMNAPFGAARVAPGTGIVLAPAPTDQGVGFSALAPVMLASKFNGELYFASAGSGGAPAALAEALVLDAVMKRALPLDQAMQLPRAYDSGNGEVLDESGGLRLGRLNSIFCSRGVPANADTCQLRNDYRGNGLASILGED